MRQVTLVDVHQPFPQSHPSVVLQELEPPYRKLDISVGYPEGVAIYYAWHHLAYPRPLSHELFTTILEQFAVSLEVLEITSVQGATFNAQITLVSGSSKRVLPCRPSDGLALALRQMLPVPVLVDEAVLAEAGHPEPTAAEERADEEGDDQPAAPEAGEAVGDSGMANGAAGEELTPPAEASPS